MALFHNKNHIHTHIYIYIYCVNISIERVNLKYKIEKISYKKSWLIKKRKKERTLVFIYENIRNKKILWF